jgi:HK97 family phage portal protein
MTPRFFGTPSATAVPTIKSREDFVRALRGNDQDALHGIAGAKAAQAFGFFENPNGIEAHRFDGFASYLAACTKRVWCATRAMDIVANVVLSTDMQVVHRDAEKRKKKKPVRINPDLSRLLAYPNKHDTISQLLYLWVAHMKFTGNAYWFLDNINGYGQPEAIYALNPKHVRIVPSKTDRISHYVYRVGGAEIRIELNEMIHFKRPHPDNELFGLGEVEQGEDLYNEFINRSLYNTKLIANGASPSSIMVKEDFNGDQDEWDKMRAKFDERYSGVKNTGKVGWVNGKWSLLQLGIDSQKMQEMEKAKVNVEHIFLNHGVPLSVAGFGAANYATSRQDRINMRSDTVLPMLNLFCDSINHSENGLIARFHKDLKLDFSLAGLVDIEQVTKDYGPLVDKGAMTLNEFREKAGLPRVENPLLDAFYVNANRMPLEMAGLADVPAETGEPKPAAGGSGDGGGGGSQNV